MDANNYVAPKGNGWVVVINGVEVGTYSSQAGAESAFNTAKGAGTSGQPGTNTPKTPGVNPSSGAGAVAGATGGLVDPSAIKALMDLASQSAQQAYLNARLELEKQTAGQQWTAQQEQLAQAAAHDAWQKAIAGREADVQQAATTGYVGGINDVAQRVGDAWNRLPPEQRTGANAAAIWKTQVPGLTDAEAAQMNEAAHQFAAVNGTAMPPDIMGQALSQITNGRITGQTATLARQQMENQTGLGLLNLASQLRGPDNAFAYARTLQNVPPEMRAQLDAMMQRSGINYQGPGLATVAGQISAGGLGGATQTSQTLPMAGPTVAGATQQTQALPAYQGPAPAGAPQTFGNTMQAAGAAPQTGGSAAYQDEMMRYPAPTGTGGMTQTGTNYMTYQGTNGQPTGGTPSTDLRQATQSGQPVLRAAGTVGATTGGQAPITGLGQVSPQQWNQTPDYVKKLMLSGLEAGGADKSAELDAFTRQLPRYSGPRTARVAV